MLVDELCYLHSKLQKKECLRIILVRDGWEITCDKTDLVRISNNMFRIIRANGTVTSVNPEHVIVACTMKREGVL